MFNKIIHFSLSNKALILVLAALLIGFGGYETIHLPIDVLPDLNRPRVTVMTECPGLAPEEVEIQVTRQVEIALNGSTGVSAIRSNSSAGLSIVVVDFDWEVEPYRARQVISERLAVAAEALPDGFVPRMTPLSSVMGQILMLCIWDESGKISPLELRTISDWVIRQRLQGIEGVSEVFPVGGERKQYQVRVRTDDLLRYGVTLNDVSDALERSNSNVTGGYLTSQGPNQYLVRSVGRIQNISDLKNLVVDGTRQPPLVLNQLADIVEAGAVKVGDAAAHIKTADNAKDTKSYPCVVLTIGKQPSKDTRVLTDEVHAEIARIQTVLKDAYPGLKIETLYQQETFINLAVSNCIEALWTGAILVVAVLALFLMNLRTTLITVIAMPLAIISTCLIFAWFGLSVNTMTLGGLAVAIGELVDDAIVDVENIFRRLKLYFSGETFLGENNSQYTEKDNPIFNVVFNASAEIRNSIVHGTMIVVLVFLPLFYLTGIEGKLFSPLGVAYVVSILSSLAVSLTVTPVMCYLLLPSVARKEVEKNRKRFDAEQERKQDEQTEQGEQGEQAPTQTDAAAPRYVQPPEGVVLRAVQYLAEKAIRFSLEFPKFIIISGVAVSLAAGVVFFNMDRDFMPPFNEGALQVNMDLMPGASLETTSEMADKLSAQLLQIPGVESVVRKAGRSEMDEHAVPVNTSEMVVSLAPDSGRTLDEIIDDVARLIDPNNIPGTVAFYDQPLQHLINHLRSGTRSKIAVKVRGDNPMVIRQRAKRIQELLKDIPDIGSLRADPIQVDIPQVRITLKREELTQYGLRPEEVNRIIETAMNGRISTEILEGQRSFEVLVRLSDKYRENLSQLAQMPIELPSGGMTPLESIAHIDAQSSGPSQIDHEKGRPQIIIQSNPRKRGAVDVKEDIEAALAPHWEELTQGNVEIELAGLFESEQAASRQIALLTCLSLVGVFMVLFSMFKSANLSLQIMAILPLALVGAVAAMILTGQSRTVPNLVGMISLCGVASRNGILLIDHYLHLVKFEGELFSKEMIIRAGRDRVAPVLMTALTSAIGLIPLTLSPNQPGREILYPIATVVVGGMITSTLMEFFVRPALFWTFYAKNRQTANR